MEKKMKGTPTINQLLKTMPDDVADSFTEKQRSYLSAGLRNKKWSKHPVDIRGTFTIPFVRKEFFFVFLLGKEQRELSRLEEQVSLLTLAFMVSLVVIFCTLTGLLIMYLIKSALGINLFDGFSLGIWDWFESLWN